MVLGDRHPQQRHLRSRDRLGGPGRFPGRPEIPALRRPTSRRSTCAPPAARPSPRGWTACSARRPARKTPVRSTSQPSDALTAQADATGALDTLFLGLGAVALLVGAIGVANIMVISVLERRSDIGLRRALGATRGQIRTQFLAEAVLLSLAVGVIGIITGAAATAAYARAHGETVVIPPEAWAGGLAAAVIIGALAGLLPAIRAARLSPTQALWSI
jgi:predicted lysophospholipase L1 biosynthesis ABC-type transport system permease subunit